METLKVKLLHSIILTTDDIGYKDNILTLDKSLAQLLIGSKKAVLFEEDNKLEIGTEINFKNVNNEEVNLETLNKESSVKGKKRK